MKDYLAVGYISQTKGINGEVKVKSLTEKEERFLQPGNKFFLSPPTEHFSELTIEKAARRRDLLAIKFKEINSIEQATELKGRYLEIPAQKLTRGEYYWHQLIGLEVMTTEGKKIGEIAEIQSSKAHDIYVVKNEKEYSVPAVKDVVKEINLEKGYILIKPIKGLLEI